LPARGSVITLLMTAIAFSPSAGGGLGEEVVERVLHDRSGQVPLLGRDDQLLLLTSLGRPVSLP
jgi:hypothetical protein